MFPSNNSLIKWRNNQKFPSYINALCSITAFLSFFPRWLYYCFSSGILDGFGICPQQLLFKGFKCLNYILIVLGTGDFMAIPFIVLKYSFFWDLPPQIWLTPHNIDESIWDFLLHKVIVIKHFLKGFIWVHIIGQ